MYANTTSAVGHKDQAVVRYDPSLRRVWIGGQRLHHGLTGVILAALGGVLIAHDWKDRRVWFQRGPQL